MRRRCILESRGFMSAFLLSLFDRILSTSRFVILLNANGSSVEISFWLIMVIKLINSAKNGLIRPRKSEFSLFSSQEIGSSLASLKMIFEALRSELFRFKFNALSSKILKIPEFNLTIDPPPRCSLILFEPFLNIPFTSSTVSLRSMPVPIFKNFEGQS